MLSPRWRKVARDLWNNKSRTALVVASIAIGVFAFGGLFIASDVSARDMNQQYLDTLPADITFALGASPVDDDFVRWLARQPLVTATQAKTVHPVEVVLAGEVQTADLIGYQDYAAITVSRITPHTGAYPPGTEEMLFERSFMEPLGVAVGQVLAVRTPDGDSNDLLLAGVVHDLELQPGRINPVTPIYVSQRTLLRMGLSDRYNRMEVRVNRNAGVPLATIAEDLREEMERRGVVVQSVSLNRDAEHWSADVVAGLSTVLVFAGLGSLLLSAFLVVNTISGIMASQKRQIGVMKIIGASRPQIIAVYLVLVGILGLVAFVIAFPLSLVLGAGLLGYFSDFLNFDTPMLEVPAYIVALEFAMALLVPIGAALQPVLAGTGITAAEAITDHTVPSKNNPIDLLLARLSGLPRPALISVRNTFRRKIRLLVTVFTLTMAGAFFISIVNVRSGLLTDIDELLALANYDVQLRFTEPVDQAGLERRIAAFPGIATLESWVTTSVVYERPDRTESQNYGLVGLSADSVFVDPPVVEGRWLVPFDPARRYEIVVSNEVTAGEPSIAVGDTITLKRGADDQTFTVVGIVDSDFDNIYGYFDTVQDFRGTVGLSDQVLVELSPDLGDADHGPLSVALIDYLEDRDIEVASTTLQVDIVEGVTGGFNVLVYLLLGMAVLIAFVAGLGLTGTMSLNVMERTREIGVMRAVGAGNNAIRLMFVGEGILIGLLSTVLALPLSYPGTLVFANVLGDVIFGNPLTVIVAPLGIFVWFGIVLLVSSAASVAPANRASQISIREAISYE